MLNSDLMRSIAQSYMSVDASLHRNNGSRSI
jgi:hypothetical protein